jgi:hypothetical protein
METIFSLPALADSASWTPQVGEIVENFGSIGRVLSVDPERGILLRGMPGQGFSRNHDKWFANPEKCRPVR